jgi:hypothetical protein
VQAQPGTVAMLVSYNRKFRTTFFTGCRQWLQTQDTHSASMQPVQNAESTSTPHGSIALRALDEAVAIRRRLMEQSLHVQLDVERSLDALATVQREA